MGGLQLEFKAFWIPIGRKGLMNFLEQNSSDGIKRDLSDKSRAMSSCLTLLLRREHHNCVIMGILPVQMTHLITKYSISVHTRGVISHHVTTVTAFRGRITRQICDLIRNLVSPGAFPCSSVPGSR